jgi:hypothetical protein
MSQLISDDMVQDALNHLLQSSEDEAAARAMRERLDFKRKSVRSEQLLRSNQSSIAAKDAAAETSREYTEAVEEYVKAIERDEFLRSKRNTCVVIIEAWRTQNANERAISRVR